MKKQQHFTSTRESRSTVEKAVRNLEGLRLARKWNPSLDENYSAIRPDVAGADEEDLKKIPRSSLCGHCSTPHHPRGSLKGVLACLVR